jgi:hypothetical protein
VVVVFVVVVGAVAVLVDDDDENGDDCALETAKPFTFYTQDISTKSCSTINNTTYSNVCIYTDLRGWVS